MIAAVVLVVAVIGLVVFLGSNKDKKKPAEQADSSGWQPPPRTDNEPPPPPRMDPPPMDEHIRGEAKELVKTYGELATEGKSLYEEALRARDVNDLDLYQEKLREAAFVYGEIKDSWNDIIMQMPSNDDWDEEQVMNHYLGNENEKVRRLQAPLKDITKQMTIAADGGD